VKSMITLLSEFYAYMQQQRPDYRSQNLTLDHENDSGFFDFQLNNIYYRLCIMRDRNHSFFELDGSYPYVSKTDKCWAMEIDANSLSDMIDKFDRVIVETEEIILAQ
jgi:hypothetical protein